MSRSTATLPRSAGNGAALVVVVTDLLINLFDGAAEKFSRPAAPKMAVPAMPMVAAAPLPAASARAAKPGLWQLYRMAGGSDSVNPKILGALRAD